MKLFKYFLLIFIVSILSFSCEKEVYIELPEPEESFVVEGWIEQDDYPVVVLTRNSSYFDKVDSTTLSKLFVTTATVLVSDGETTEQLSLDYSNIFLGIYPPVQYKGKQLKGEVGKTYELTIYVEGDTITGKTTIPEPVTFESLWWQPDTAGTDLLKDSLGYLWATFTDDPNTKNYYRIFSKRIGRDRKFIPLFGSVYPDMFFDGKTITFSMYRGIETFSDADAIQSEADAEELFYYKKGDTVIVKLTSIDEAHYLFWRTIEQELFTGGNPFVYPAIIRHNVVGALGVFGGYGATYRTLPE